MICASRAVVAALTGLMIAGLGANARAAQVVIPAVKDNTLIQTIDGGYSNGASPYLFAGRTVQGAGIDKRRGVLMFDIAAAIPPGSTITAAVLTLHMSRSQAGTTPVRLHRLLASWGEGTSNPSGQGGAGEPSTPNDATWLHRFWPSTLWTTVGGDFAPTFSALTLVGGINTYNWSSTSVIADVQGWVDNPGTNFGWTLVGDETIAPSAKRFDGRTNTSVNDRPRLTITFTPGAVVGACCIAADGACHLVDPTACAGLGGAYQGNSTICTPNPCPQPPGACCLPNGSCSVFSQVSCTSASGTWQGTGTSCTPNPCPLFLEPYVDALPIPPVMQPTTGVPGGAATYNVTITEFNQQLHRDLPPTRLWGYAGTYPGPTFECASGSPITVNWINDLRDAKGQLRTEHYLPVDLCLKGPDTLGPSPRTVTHLYGGHVPPEVDGYPEGTFLPGQETSYVYPNNQQAATLWYHDHALGITRLNVYMGLTGFYIIRDAFEQALNLPTGEYEIPLVIQDRSFNEDGSLVYPEMWMDHFHGEFVLVNGKVWPYLNVKQGKYRFRLLNGSNSRAYTLTLSSLQTFQQIGTDLGLLPAPVPVSQLMIMPGERADVVVDFAGIPAGTQVLMNNSAPSPFPGEPGVGVVPKVMKFNVTSQSGHTVTLPASLRPVPALNQSLAAQTRDFMLQLMPDDCTTLMWMINGMPWDDIEEYPRLNTMEIWRYINRSDVVHPMHMHLVKFQVIDRQAFQIVDNEVVPSGPVYPRDSNEASWKDTVRTMPGEITRVIARFEDHAGLFAYECAALEREDHEMMRQFEALVACAGDIAPAGDFDGTVNVDDLLVIINSWGPCVPSPCRADVTGNGIVNIDDLLTVINGWGPCPL